MADIALVSADAGVSILGGTSPDSFSMVGHIPTGVAVDPGAPVIIDPTTGRYALARGTTAPLARVFGLTMRKQAAGYGLTVVRYGIMDGWDLSALDYDDPVYLSDTLGRLSDTAGTVPTVIGRVIPATAVLLGSVFDKVLFVELA